MILVSQPKSKILYGSDPESFAAYVKAGTMYAIPPYWFRHNGTPIVEEDERHPVFIASNEYKVHEDGAAFEFSVRPSFDPKDLFDRIQAAAKEVSDKILSMTNDVLPNLQFVPTIGWDLERWEGMPKDFFMSTMFGCDPFQDVFNLEKKAKVVDASLHPERYAGAHLHFSGSSLIKDDPHQAIRCLASTAGLAAIKYSTMRELEYRRTYLYGVPGAFRVQNYGKKNPFGLEYAAGIEYRTPSATWAGDWNVAKHVLSWAEIGITRLLDEGLGEEILPEIIEPTIHAILNADQELADELLSYVESKL